MSLLPKSYSQFADEDYWDHFFKSRGEKSFDWYGEYAQLSTVLCKYVRTADAILMVGCGNSTLSENLYDLSYENITNIDISENVISMMRKAHERKRPNMAFTRMDATEMSYDAESFRVAIDKGTFDAVLPDPADTSTATALLTDVMRCLKPMGCYIIITLAQSHVIQTLLSHFSSIGACIVRAHLLPSDPHDKSGMPVFAVVITKLKGAMPSIWESVLSSHIRKDTKPRRHQSSEELLAAIKGCQRFAMFRQSLNKDSKSGHKSGKQEIVELMSQDSEEPRYKLHIINSRPTKSNGGSKLLAVFIAPLGSNDEVYYTDAGRVQLAEQVGYRRLIVATLSPQHKYEDLDQVKAELSSYVMELAPLGTKEANSPFLTSSEGLGTC